MKEQLYTIPLNDAFAADDECPFCYIEQKVEQDLLDFTLGSGSSYMESDIRDMTDKAGFCRYHFQKMFQYGNTLGNAWILKTHFRKINQELDQEIKRFKPAKISFPGSYEKVKGSQQYHDCVDLCQAGILLHLQSVQGYLCQIYGYFLLYV